MGKADNKIGACGGFSPHVAAVVEHSLAGERQQSQAVVLAFGNERFEQPIANPTRNSGPVSST